jgi:tetratricopeptide (TPR) repeat protein
LNVQANQNIGVAFLATNEVAKARQAFATILEIDPNQPAALFNLGLLYQNQLQDPDSALRYYQRFVAVQRGKLPADHEVFSHIKQVQSMPKRPKPRPAAPAPAANPPKGGTR